MAGYITIRADKDYRINVGTSFTRFQQKKKFWDCKIILGKETLYCHSVIISSLSPVIEEMIEIKIRDGSEKEISFEDIKPEVMRKITNYMYTGSVNIPRELVLEVVQVCDELKIEDLKERCLFRVPDILSPQIAMGWMRYAHKHELSSIFDSCKRYVSDSFLEVTREKQFIQLSLDDLKATLQELYDSVAPERLLTSVLSWINYDKKTRKMALDYTHGYLKLKYCGKQFLSESAKEHIEIFRSNPEFNRRVTHMLHKTKLSPVVIGGRVHTGKNHGTSARVWKQSSETSFVEITGIAKELFTIIPTICLYNLNTLILTGGETIATDSCVMLDMSTKKWKKMKSLKSPRSRHASACILQQLFVLGGDTSVTSTGLREWTTSGDVLNIDEEHGEWQSAPWMPSALKYPKITHTDESIYLMGVDNPNLYQFDVLKNVWSPKTPMPQNPGSSFSITSGKGKLYAAGGEKKCCWQYSISTDLWAKLSSPARRHAYGALIFHQNSLLLIGGNSDEIEGYSTEQDTWVEAPYKLPEKVVGHCAFMMDLEE